MCGLRNKDNLFVLFSSFIFVDGFDKNLIELKTCLWNQGTYRFQIVRLSRS